MNKDSCVIYKGSVHSLEWYYSENGDSVAYDYFLKTPQEQKRKFLMLAKRMGMPVKYGIKQSLGMKATAYLPLSPGRIDICRFLAMIKKLL